MSITLDNGDVLTKRQQFHYIIAVFGLFLLAVGLPTSKFLSSVGGVMLGINWLIEGDWRRKWLILKSDRHLWLLLVLYLVFVWGLIQSSPHSDGMRLLRTKVPMLYIPLVVATTRIKFSHIRMLTEFYAYMVALTTLLSWYNLLFSDREIRNIYPFCKHISHGIQMCVGCIICFSFRHKRIYNSKKHNNILLAVGFYLIICMIAFAKYTALAAGLITLMVWLTYYVYKNCSLKIKIGFPIAIVLIMSVVGLGLRRTISNYFTPRFDTEAVHKQFTSRGNPYTFDTNTIVENGQYVGVYVCDEELAQAWPEKSQKPYNEVYKTLIRFLNSKGDYKDYDAVAALTAEEVADIENGIANIKYKSFLSRLYVTFFEFTNQQDVEEKSMVKRFYCWRLAGRLIAERPLLGYGNGTTSKIFQSEQMKNPNIKNPLVVPHQQYLEDAMTFGIPVALIILFVYILLIYKGIKEDNPLLVLTLLMLLLTLFVEGNNYQAATILFAIVTTVFSYYNLTSKPGE